MMRPEPLLALVAIVIVLVLRENRGAPGALVLMVPGLGMVAWQGRPASSLELAVTLPPPTVPRRVFGVSEAARSCRLTREASRPRIAQ